MILIKKIHQRDQRNIRIHRGELEFYDGVWTATGAKEFFRDLLRVVDFLVEGWALRTLRSQGVKLYARYRRYNEETVFKTFLRTFSTEGVEGGGGEEGEETAERNTASPSKTIPERGAKRVIKPSSPPAPTLCPSSIPSGPSLSVAPRRG